MVTNSDAVTSGVVIISVTSGDVVGPLGMQLFPVKLILSSNLVRCTSSLPKALWMNVDVVGPLLMQLIQVEPQLLSRSVRRLLSFATALWLKVVVGPLLT